MEFGKEVWGKAWLEFESGGGMGGFEREQCFREKTVMLCGIEAEQCDSLSRGIAHGRLYTELMCSFCHREGVGLKQGGR